MEVARIFQRTLHNAVMLISSATGIRMFDLPKIFMPDGLPDATLPIKKKKKKCYVHSIIFETLAVVGLQKSQTKEISTINAPQGHEAMIPLASELIVIP